jgi:hypothetical protein
MSTVAVPRQHGRRTIAIREAATRVAILLLLVRGAMALRLLLSLAVGIGH